jgi:hypothetical protein
MSQKTLVSFVVGIATTIVLTLLMALDLVPPPTNRVGDVVCQVKELFVSRKDVNDPELAAKRAWKPCEAWGDILGHEYSNDSRLRPKRNDEQIRNLHYGKVERSVVVNFLTGFAFVTGVTISAYAACAALMTWWSKKRSA